MKDNAIRSLFPFIILLIIVTVAMGTITGLFETLVG